MTLLEANSYLKLTEEELSELSALQARVDASEQLSRYLDDAYRAIYLEERDHAEVEKIYNACVPEDAFSGLFYILVGVRNMERVIDFYREKGIALDILSHTLQDVALWIRNHKRYRGRLGLTSRYWISLGFGGKLFRLGRMEFEKTTIREEVQLPGLRKGDPALEGHVPQGEPLDHDACWASYRAAFPFFEKYFQYHAKAVHLQTWMLDPALREILPPESNIMRWQNDATLVPSGDLGSGIGRFVFGTKVIDPATAPRDTTLRRKIVERIEAGGSFSDRAGVILRETIMQGE